MRLTILLFIATALVLNAGCAKHETEPADQTPAATEAAQSDAEPITSEDFESGEVEGSMEVGANDEETGEETP